jgi:hypothetical protein
MVWNTVLLDSEPPDVKIIVSGFTPASFPTIDRACSTRAWASLPDECMLEAFPNTSKSSTIPAFTSGLSGVVAL